MARFIPASQSPSSQCGLGVRDQAPAAGRPDRGQCQCHPALAAHVQARPPAALCWALGRCQRHPALAAHRRARPPAPRCAAQPRAQHTLLLHLPACCCARRPPGTHKTALPRPPQALQPWPGRVQGLRFPGSCTPLLPAQAAAAGRRATHAPLPRGAPHSLAAAGMPQPRTHPAPVALLVHRAAQAHQSASASRGRRRSHFCLAVLQGLMQPLGSQWQCGALPTGMDHAGFVKARYKPILQSRCLAL